MPPTVIPPQPPQKSGDVDARPLNLSPQRAGTHWCAAPIRQRDIDSAVGQIHMAAFSAPAPASRVVDLPESKSSEQRQSFREGYVRDLNRH